MTLTSKSTSTLVEPQWGPAKWIPWVPWDTESGSIPFCAGVCSGGIMTGVEADSFDEPAFFGAVAGSGARALLIGRQALIALGLSVMTADYDYWLHIDDMEAFNRALAQFDLRPSRPPEQARATGRYVLENSHKIDVLVARAVPTVDGTRVAFDGVWQRRQSVHVFPGVVVTMPSLDDLILTKRFGARPKDAEDIRLLEVLRARGGS